MLSSGLLRKLASKNAGLVLLGTFVSNNVVTLRWVGRGDAQVNDDAMVPVLCPSPAFKGLAPHTADLAVVLRATRYHKNDVIMYKNPNTGRECFGRLTQFNSREELGAMASKLPSGHCW